MDDPGFERRVQEGMAALERSRECLRTHRDKPPSWEKITPESLQPAIKYISREFGTAEWQLAMQIECACYLSLHPELSSLPRYKGGENLIRSDIRQTWHLQFAGMNEAERFAHAVTQYAEILEHKIIVPFNSFLKIGLAQESRLDLPPSLLLSFRGIRRWNASQGDMRLTREAV